MSYDTWLDSADPGLYAEEPIGPSEEDSLYATCPSDVPLFDQWHELCCAERSADLLAAA